MSQRRHDGPRCWNWTPEPARERESADNRMGSGSRAARTRFNLLKLFGGGDSVRAADRRSVRQRRTGQAGSLPTGRYPRVGL